MGNPCKPLLLLDVDGVISLFGFASRARPAGDRLMVDGTPHLISAAAARHLQELAADFELAWCTGWEEKANEYLPLALGLPAELPVLSFDRALSGPSSQAHWKLAAIEAHAGPGRPLAWIDDAFNETCHAWAAQRAGPTLLVATEPAVGLCARQVESAVGRAPAGPAGARARSLQVVISDWSFLAANAAGCRSRRPVRVPHGRHGEAGGRRHAVGIPSSTREGSMTPTA